MGLHKFACLVRNQTNILGEGGGGGLQFSHRNEEIERGRVTEQEREVGRAESKALLKPSGAPDTEAETHTAAADISPLSLSLSLPFSERCKCSSRSP